MTADLTPPAGRIIRGMDEPGRVAGLFMWAWGLVFFAIVLYRLKKRRGHIGAAAAGTVYDLIHEDKRKAIEIVVSEKAAARDFEHADDDKEPTSSSSSAPGRSPRSARR
jgi:hypothetical protein